MIGEKHGRGLCFFYLDFKMLFKEEVNCSILRVRS